MSERPDDNTSSRSETPRWQVEQLLNGSREAILVHNGEDYRLRVTSTGKLILTK